MNVYQLELNGLKDIAIQRIISPDMHAKQRMRKKWGVQKEDEGGSDDGEAETGEKHGLSDQVAVAVQDVAQHEVH